MKLSIEELFETRYQFESKYPFAMVIEKAIPNSDVLCIARSLYYLLNKIAELKSGLLKGLNFKFACLDPECATLKLTELTHTHPEDLRAALFSLSDLIKWAEDKKPSGSLELRFH